MRRSHRRAGTLRLGDVRHANCGDPALYGEQVLAVSYVAQPASRTRGVGEFAVRIAHVDPAARDGYTLGPVVMTYQQCSDCSAQWIYGDGSLWLYGHGELLRVSDTSGKVVQRWAIPPNPRELLAVDADGLWFAPSVEGGFPIHTSASQLIRYESLYRVTPGAKTPARVFEIPGGSALWLVAAGHAVWLESGGPRSRSRFDLAPSRTKRKTHLPRKLPGEHQSRWRHRRSPTHPRRQRRDRHLLRQQPRTRVTNRDRAADHQPVA